MPLQPGSSKQARSQNIRELLHAYAAKGSIGNTKPRSAKHASRIAAAIAYRKAREGKDH